MNCTSVSHRSTWTTSPAADQSVAHLGEIRSVPGYYLTIYSLKRLGWPRGFKISQLSASSLTIKNSISRLHSIHKLLCRIQSHNIHYIQEPYRSPSNFLFIFFIYYFLFRIPYPATVSQHSPQYHHAGIPRSGLIVFLSPPRGSGIQIF